MKTLKKILGAILAVALLISTAPLSSAAPSSETYNFRNDTQSAGITIYYSVNGNPSLRIMGRGETISFNEKQISAIMFYVKVEQGYTYRGITFTAGQQDGISSKIEKAPSELRGYSFAKATSNAIARGCTYEYHYSGFNSSHLGDSGTRAFNISVTADPVLSTAITYYKNDGTSVSTSQNVYQNKRAVLLGYGAFSREGYSLDGWNTSADGRGEFYSLDDSYNVGSTPVKLYAMWKVESYNISINYQYADGSPAAPRYTNTLDYGEEYSVNSPLIPGYSPDKAKVEGAMGAEDVILTVTYSINSYNLIIHYEYADGSQAAPDYVKNYNHGESYSVESPEITGYNTATTTVSGRMTANAEVTVVYRANTHKLTIHYQYVDGGQAAPDYTATLGYNSAYSVNSPELTGFTPYTRTVRGTMPDKDVEITVIYNINTYALTILYQHEDGSEIAPEYMQTYTYGSSYRVESPDVIGHTPNTAVVTGDKIIRNTTIVVTYTANSYKLTIHYQYEDGSEAAPDFTETVVYNGSYRVNSPEVTGHTADTAVVVGKMGASDVEITVTYVAKDYSLTIHYQYEDGSEAAPDYTGTIAYGQEYSVDSPEIIGHTANTAVVTGNMGAANVELLVTYIANSYSLTVHYQYEDGSEAASDFTETIVYNGSYSINSPEITGHAADTAIVAGNMGASDVEITVTYVANGYSLTVHYQYESGNVAAPDYVGTIAYGQEYSVDSPVIPGYTANVSTVSGSMDAANIEVTVTYTVNSYAINYFVNGALYDSDTINYGSPIAPLANVIRENFRFSGWSTVPATMPAHNVNVYGTLVPTYTVTWVMPDGTVLETDRDLLEGDMPAYDAAEPELDGSEFTGWSPEVEPVTGNTTYVAQFQAEIIDPVNPLDPGSGSGWALLNLILTVITGIVSAVMIGAYFFGKRKKEGEEFAEKTSKSKLTRLLTLAPFVASVVAFVLTQNMNNSMAFTDKWTVLMMGLAVVSAITAFIAAKSNKTQKEETEAK